MTITLVSNLHAQMQHKFPSQSFQNALKNMATTTFMGRKQLKEPTKNAEIDTKLEVYKPEPNHD